MTRRVRRVSWLAGWPVRSALLLVIAAYRRLIGPALGARCRFYPSCSAYAAEAIAHVGWVRGTALAAWRVLRCSPLSRGGIDLPPRRAAGYESIIQSGRVPLPAAREGAA